MSDSSSSLRTLLRKVDDGTAQSIQQAAAAMMKHYDKSATLAVNEWRNALQHVVQTSNNDQQKAQTLLSLLYVLNEVLQISKRNRGNNFLAAVSPVLGASLRYICSHVTPPVVEKIRRTLKIWGDRHVFSVRFVNDLLQGLEPYRQPSGGNRPPAAAQFSPEHQESHSSEANKQDTNNDDNDSDDILDLIDKAGRKDDSDLEDDGEGDDFENADGDGPKLELDMNIVERNLVKSVDEESKKRPRRGSTGSNSRRRTSQTGSTGQQRRKSTLSAGNLLDLWQRLVRLQHSYTHAQMSLKNIDTNLAKTDSSVLENLVGEEVQQAYRDVVRQQEQIQIQRQTLHSIAQERHECEQELIRYIGWLEKAIQQDADDEEFSNGLEVKISSFATIHGAIVKARDERLRKEEEERRIQLVKERERKEQEENEKFRQAALSKETEAKPGMVWNPSTREYQALNTDESWRD